MRGQEECLLWVAPGQEPPRDLVESLNKRGVRARIRRDPLEVLASACKMSARSRIEGFVVVFCMPSLLT
ncbi:hypothetical protein, partial [Nostoc sp. CHAB 5715]|uniref:hypothetical protein n=1 Tax=Nostoc sp. CHAB 5715 TaxID=2780400 RepID=UPI001E5FEF65